MSELSIGILGLPNVGKSTLFRALTSISVPAENYPFCTIDPNVGVVPVPDERLEALAGLVESGEVTPAAVEFVDIAGLVEGASRGEGLGNEFLAHVREADALAHVVRCFEDGRVARAGGGGDPIADREVVETELALADLSRVEDRLERAERRARSGERDAETERDLLQRVLRRLERGEPAGREPLDADERRALRDLELLTLKPMMYVANVDEEGLEEESPAADRLRRSLAADEPKAEVVRICARLEAEALDFPPEEREELLRAHGLESSGLDRLIRAGYRLLGLITFFTFNEKELRARALPEGSTAPEAAGRVHTDFREGFIRADAISVEEFRRHGSMEAARRAGAVRSDGRDYVVRDGDILLFHARA